MQLTSALSETLLLLIEDHPDAYFVKDSELRYVYANKAFLAENQLTLEELQGRTAFDILPESTAKKCHEMDAAAIASGKPATHEDTFELSGSRFQRGEVTLSPQKNEFGVVNFLLGVARNVTARYQSELNSLARAEYLAGLDDRRMRRVCSCCSRMHSKNDTWDVVDTQVSASVNEGYLTHGFCEGCYESYLEANGI